MATVSAALSHLRRHTAAVHARLHDQPEFRRLQDGTLDLPGYRALLRRLWGFYAPLEQAMTTAWPDGWPGLELTGIDLASRHKAGLLRADLVHLGDRPAALADLPRCPALPSLAAAGDLVGCLYVVEGAGLGGQVLARHLAGLLGGGEDGRRFFLGRRPDPLPWRRTLDLVDATAAGGQLDAMTHAAEATFAAMEHWLNARDWMPAAP